MTVLFTFPGQGTQTPGMLADLMQHQLTRSLLERASAHLRCDVSQLDTADALRNNRNVQIAITLSGYASAALLRDQGITPDYVLGLSIGAFPAAMFSGALSFEDGLTLVAKRGELMASAYPDGYGMAAIVGLSLQQLKPIMQILADQGYLLYIANINTESQIVVSGESGALKRLCQTCVEHRATSAKLLKVNVPSHCTLLAPQAEIFHDTFAQVEMLPPRITYVSANSARVLYDVDQVSHDLTFNMAHQVRWWETVAMLRERGVQITVEMKPGSVLTALCRTSMPDTICVALAEQNPDNIPLLIRQYS